MPLEDSSLQTDRRDMDERDVIVTVPNFNSVIDKLHGLLISNFWYDDEINPSRVFRPAFRRANGIGSDLVMPLAASWLSSGPEASSTDSNVIAFPEAVDRTFIHHMQKLGVLGQHVYMRDFQQFPELATHSNRLIYNVDDLPDEWDCFSKNKADTVRRVNTKKYLDSLSGFAAPYELVDVRTTTVEDFNRLAQPDGMLYVKKNNTENTSRGVLICHTPSEYLQTVHDLRQEAEQHHLDFEIVLQQRIEGKNRSFQFLMTPDDPSHLQLIAHSFQLIGGDGKTYLGNENPPLTPEAVTPALTAMIIDMASRIRLIDPQTFGFVMCDYFQTDKASLTFDPGLRVTGNTATCMARLFAEKIAEDGIKRHSETFFVAPPDASEISFKEFIRPVDALMSLPTLERGDPCLLPWGYNHLMGRGMFIAIGRTRDEMQAILQEGNTMLQSTR